MILKELYELTDNMLAAAGVEDHRFDTDCLFEDILDADKVTLILHGDMEVPEPEADRLMYAAEKRCSGVPLQYILGKWEFYGRTFFVGEGVLIPRPDTEILAGKVIEHFAAQKNGSPEICELCSGSGCIAVTLKDPRSDSSRGGTFFRRHALSYKKYPA